MTAELFAITAGGFLSSAHCIGMCGGFAGALGAARVPFWPLFARQMVYHAGRIFTYAFLGAVAGTLGMQTAGIQIGPVTLQQGFALLAGLLMIGIGLTTFGILRLPARWSSLGAGLMAPLFGYFMNARGWTGYFFAGMANGYLPCGLVYAFLALALAGGGAPHGAAVMVFFGLGTLPAMLFIGLGTRLLPPLVRQRILRGAAVFVVVLGGLTIYRGWPTRTSACCEHKEPLSVAREHQLPR